jgi:hypothetical protein
MISICGSWAKEMTHENAPPGADEDEHHRGDQPGRQRDRGQIAQRQFAEDQHLQQQRVEPPRPQAASVGLKMPL